MTDTWTDITGLLLWLVKVLWICKNAALAIEKVVERVPTNSIEVICVHLLLCIIIDIPKSLSPVNVCHWGLSKALWMCENATLAAGKWWACPNKFHRGHLCLSKALWTCKNARSGC